jgi:PAS domain S-box-containing protein
MIALTLGSLNLLYGLAFVAMGFKTFALLTMPFTAADGVVLWLNKRGHTRAARILLIAALQLGCLLFAVLIGPPVYDGIADVAFSLGVIPLILYDRKDYAPIAAGAFGAFLLQSIHIWMPASVRAMALTGMNEQLAVVTMLSNPITFLMLFAVVFHLFRTNAQSEAALRAKAVRLDLYARSSSHAYVEFDLDGTIVGWNRAATAMFGYEEAEAVGHSYELMVPRERRPGVSAAAGYERLRGSREGFESNTTALRKDGSVFESSSLTTPLIDDDGRFLGAVSVIQDVTARNAERRRVESSEATLRAVFDNSAVGITYIEIRAGRPTIVRCNTRFSEMLGYTIDEMLGMSIFSYFDPADGDADRALAEAIRKGDLDRTERQRRYLRKDGSYVWVDVSLRVVPGGDENFRAVVVYVQDITERRRIESELAARKAEAEASAQLLTTTINALPVGIGYLDRSFANQFSNQAFYEFFGTAANFDAASADRMRQARMTARDGVPDRVLVRATPLWAKEQRLLDVEYIPHRNADGSVAGVVVLGADITERVRSEAELEDQRSRMVSSAKLAILGEMAGGVAHEINNPLAIIEGKVRQIHALLDRPELERLKVTSGLTVISAMSERIARIIRGLKTISREAAGDPFVRTQISDIVADSLALCGERFRHQSVRVDVEAVGAGLYAECRPAEIAQVLLNLLSNAFDAVAGTREAWVRVEVGDAGGEVEVAVADSGPGIAPEVRERMMNPFFTTKDVGKGTGLGLSISRGIIDAHGGSLRYDGSDGNTRFVFRLPKIREAEASP